MFKPGAIAQVIGGAHSLPTDRNVRCECLLGRIVQLKSTEMEGDYRIWNFTEPESCRIDGHHIVASEERTLRVLPPDYDVEAYDAQQALRQGTGVNQPALDNV